MTQTSSDTHTSADGTTERTPTAIDAIAERHFDATMQLSPIEATYLGVPVRQDEYDDLSPAGHDARAELARATLADLATAEPADDIDRVTVAAMRERLQLEIDIHEAGHHLGEVNVLACPLQSLRDVYDLMPTDTEEQWATITRRLTALPTALEQWRTSLSTAADRGHVSAKRQIEACITQCDDLVGDDGFFTKFATGARTKDGAPLPDAGQQELTAAAQGAAAAYGDLRTFFETELLHRAPTRDAIGRERYQLASRTFLGATVDLEETYAWGQQETARLAAEMERTADRIKPGATVKDAIAALGVDPAYQLHGTDELQRWMQTKADEVMDLLGGTHFDIPDPVRTIECRIAPTHTGGIYYTGPSEDFTRPGRMWWSVPKGVETFGTWAELSTVYHEGVPGHHLQIAQTTYRAELLNRWRRMLCWVSGHGEGWALYAERLMVELGFMDDPGNYLGFLDAQSLRAARVVLDIGIHCGFEAPAEVGGGEWTYDKAWQFLSAHANNDEASLRFELDRYLGWPGQAPSYKIGERIWMQLRDETAAREGDSFDAKAFHRRALDVGSVGLDVLVEAMRA
ncbi:DUF885 domain-containing protein [Knoellia subterranea]|uniref:DUF885 domain-containing protein n=1 Tax=Knoellia subterranea KCTC 19937 TaxID=1385521 RepID=A0A0A0JMP7_9MICO|nr:DUF885 domain-containing protein [Knoellia subterranea]KGN36896.1 hypothetical protein N803_15900 [Knoellia subterranea KCTC 19937]